MAQGNLKKKVKLPVGAKQKKQHIKKQSGVKKGRRAIAPKKTQKVEYQQLQKSITKAVNSEIERNVVLKAKGLEAKPMHVVKVPDEGSSKDSAKT